MEWTKLLSANRLGKERGPDLGDSRTAFTRDNDRLIFSSAFRRMQDKTQVFPLAKSDYVRTRLTHSLEVASVGRSLGMAAAEAVISADKGLRDIVYPDAMGMVVATACLAHDIGNPPFGHSGEAAIQEWFKHSAEAARYIERWALTPSQKDDLFAFEGNAQGFRTLARLQYPHQHGGMQLTAAVLATFTKYPRGSVSECGNGVAGISDHKFGFMQSEADLFCEVAEEVGLRLKPGATRSWYRHPLAFLVEAADDICYNVMDIEDGYKAGVISFDQLHQLHRPWLDPETERRAEQITDYQQRAELYRAKTIGKLIAAVTEVFSQNLDGLMNGGFDQELVKNMENAESFALFKKAARAHVYVARPVLEVEACGFEVIGGLLSTFIGAVEDGAKNGGSRSVKSRTLLKLMPGRDADFATMSGYERALRVTDFVAGMTDSYAVEFYQRIRGISLP